VRIGDDVGPWIARRLPTAGATLQRDYLAALGRLARLPAELEVETYASHPESIVRREAVRLLLKQESTREQTIVNAVGDPDERTAFLALTAAQERCPAAAVPLIMGRVDRDELDAALRALAIRAVANRRDDAVVPWLLQRVQRRTKWMRQLKLRDKGPEMLAALNVLAAFWKDTPQTRDLMTLAMKSKDVDIRQAVSSPRVTGAMRAIPE